MFAFIFILKLFKIKETILRDGHIIVSPIQGRNRHKIGGEPSPAPTSNIIRLFIIS